MSEQASVHLRRDSAAPLPRAKRHTRLPIIVNAGMIALCCATLTACTVTMTEQSAASNTLDTMAPGVNYQGSIGIAQTSHEISVHYEPYGVLVGTIPIDSTMPLFYINAGWAGVGVGESTQPIAWVSSQQVALTLGSYE